jgi:hypothetical protein
MGWVKKKPFVTKKKGNSSTKTQMIKVGPGQRNTAQSFSSSST